MNFILFIVSAVLWMILGTILKVFTFLYYLFFERKSLNKFYLNNAITIDILANVNGELFERFCTKEKNTWFGERGTTLSESIGYLYVKKKLLKRGDKLRRFIDFMFSLGGEKNHCANAYYNKILKKLTL
jgi:hypothetical protein